MKIETALALILKYVMVIAIALMVAGLIVMFTGAGNGHTDGTIHSDYSKVFYSAAVAVLLFTPLFISLVTAILSAIKKDKIVFSIATFLFAVLIASLGIKLF